MLSSAGSEPPAIAWEGSHPCTLHFSGERCTVDIDECLSKPCKNHALCHNIQGSYLCECRPGFTGGDCDTNIDDCLASGYQHLALCFPLFPKNQFAGCCLTDSEGCLMSSCPKKTPNFSFGMFEAVKIHRVWLLEWTTVSQVMAAVVPRSLT